MSCTQGTFTRVTTVTLEAPLSLELQPQIKLIWAAQMEE